MKRFVLLTLALYAIAAASPSWAAADVASPAAEQPRLVTESRTCRSFNAARRYGESLAPCLEAAALYHRAQSGSKSSPWFYVYAEADMLAYAAADRAGLNQHADALAIALGAHRTLAYMKTAFSLDPYSKRQVTDLEQVLVRFETVERAVLGAPAANRY